MLTVLQGRLLASQACCTLSHAYLSWGQCAPLSQHRLDVWQEVWGTRGAWGWGRGAVRAVEGWGAAPELPELSLYCLDVHHAHLVCRLLLQSISM